MLYIKLVIRVRGGLKNELGTIYNIYIYICIPSCASPLQNDVRPLFCSSNRRPRHRLLLAVVVVVLLLLLLFLSHLLLMVTEIWISRRPRRSRGSFRDRWKVCPKRISFFSSWSHLKGSGRRLLI